MTRLALLAAAFASIIVVAGCSAETSESDSEPSPAPAVSAQTANGRVGVHGMVVFGANPNDAYLSHIPMFDAPHDVQVVVRGSFASAGLPRTLGDRLYTFKPKPMSLDGLRLGTVRQVTGTLYLGNFEDGGRPIANDVRFRVTEVVHQHVLDASAPEADEEDVIETGDFRVRRIGGAPGVDRIETKDGKILSCLEGPGFFRACAATDE